MKQPWYVVTSKFPSSILLFFTHCIFPFSLFWIHYLKKHLCSVHIYIYIWCVRSIFLLQTDKCHSVTVSWVRKNKKPMYLVCGSQKLYERMFKYFYSELTCTFLLTLDSKSNLILFRKPLKHQFLVLLWTNKNGRTRTWTSQNVRENTHLDWRRRFPTRFLVNGFQSYNQPNTCILSSRTFSRQEAFACSVLMRQFTFTCLSL